MSKIDGCINVDVNPNCLPDVTADILEPLPFGPESMEKVYLFHTIEHIEKKHHANLFRNIWKILKDKGRLVITFPEFEKCAKNWIDNYRGQRDFWEATIYGRQNYRKDYHVAAISSGYLKEVLRGNGYDSFFFVPEPGETYNTIFSATKTEMMPTYETLIRRDMEGIVEK